MKSNKILLLACGLIGCFTSLWAQTSVVINLAPSGTNNFSLTTLSKLTFSGTNMIVQEKTGVTQVISISQINYLNYAGMVTDYEPTAVSDEIKIYPNPSQGLVRFENMPENAVVDIFDVQGNLVQSLQNPTVWNAMDNQGGNVATGIYTCRVQSNNRQQVKKIIIK